jgi:hypothetical protein
MSRFVASEKNVSLALTLATGVGTLAAAESLGISPRTIQRKLKNPSFRRLVADMRDELIGRALGRLADNMTLASDEIAALLKAENPGLRLRAARAMLTFGLRLRDSVDLTERMRQVELELATKGAVA